MLQTLPDSQPLIPAGIKQGSAVTAGSCLMTSGRPRQGIAPPSPVVAVLVTPPLSPTGGIFQLQGAFDAD